MLRSTAAACVGIEATWAVKVVSSHDATLEDSTGSSYSGQIAPWRLTQEMKPRGAGDPDLRPKDVEMWKSWVLFATAAQHNILLKPLKSERQGEAA